MRLLPLQFAALVVAQSATITNVPTTSPSATPTPTPKTLPTFEIDVIYPLSNGSYNHTDNLPIVFAFQNFSAAIAGIPKVNFKWEIMPWGTPERPTPGGVTNDMRYYWYKNSTADDWTNTTSGKNMFNRKDFRMDDYNSFTNADGSPYILVESSNTTDWEFKPHYGRSLYALQWRVSWENERRCRTRTGLHQLFFETRVYNPAFPKDLPMGPNPDDFSDIMNGTCAQFGSMGEIDQSKEDTCSRHKPLSAERGNPCAVALDANHVTSISSRAAHLATVTPVSSTQSETLSSENYAATVMPKPHVLVALGLFGGIPLLV